MRLDALIAQRFALSRRRARDLVDTGRVEVEGAVCYEAGRAIEAEVVTIHPDRPPRARVRSRLAVLHEDRDLIVVEKPAGLLTLPTEAREKDTLMSRVSSYLLHRYRRRPYVGVVHRIDKETSGALVFARNRRALRALQDLFKRHDIERIYLAIVEGTVAQDAGVVRLPLVRDRGDGRRGVARKGEEGRVAVTHYRVVERLPGATLLELRLETGRTHQLRLHLSAIGHPVAGDPVYRPRDWPPPRPAPPRLMLHAGRLSFVHPESGERVEAAAAPPEDMAAYLAALRHSRETARMRAREKQR